MRIVTALTAEPVQHRPLHARTTNPKQPRPTHPAIQMPAETNPGASTLTDDAMGGCSAGHVARSLVASASLVASITPRVLVPMHGSGNYGEQVRQSCQTRGNRGQHPACIRSNVTPSVQHMYTPRTVLGRRLCAVRIASPFSSNHVLVRIGTGTDTSCVQLEAHTALLATPIPTAMPLRA